MRIITTILGIGICLVGIGIDKILPNVSGYWFLIPGIIMILLGLFRPLKNISKFAKFIHKKMKTNKELQYGINFKAYATDENTKLVIKSIGTSEYGFKNFSDIVNDTNLSLDIINSALDWLVMNKLATETDGRRGKVYELSPKGRGSFSMIINPKNKLN